MYSLTNCLSKKVVFFGAIPQRVPKLTNLVYKTISDSILFSFLIFCSKIFLNRVQISINVSKM